MTPQTANVTVTEVLPDHTQLPDRDGAIVHNFQEHPQSILLTSCLLPRIRERFGTRFCIGSDCGIYYRSTKPALDGCKAPDWFLVPNVPPMLDGKMRRSYVMWEEMVRPLIVIEYVSGDGSEEHDQTPNTGKFWVYENPIGAWYYAIFDRARVSLEVYHLKPPGKYERLAPNAANRFPIEPLGIELGIWEGARLEMEVPWLRTWDAASGELLLTGDERAETAEALVDDANRMREEETERAEAERKRADKALERAEKERKNADEERKRADEAAKLADEERKRVTSATDLAEKLRERLRQLGVDPEAA